MGEPAKKETTAKVIDFPNAEAPQGDFFMRMRARKDPYQSSAAKAAQADVRRLPLEYAQQAVDALGKVTPIAELPRHNAMTLAHGLSYAAKGLHVIDSHALDTCGKGTGPGGQVKIPRGARWQDRASNDPEEVAMFWAGTGEYPEDKKGNTYPFAPVGALRNVSITFPEGCDLFVLDIDGDEGRKALEELEKEHGELPQTWESITGSGGLH